MKRLEEKRKENEKEERQKKIQWSWNPFHSIFIKFSGFLITVPLLRNGDVSIASVIFGGWARETNR